MNETVSTNSLFKVLQKEVQMALVNCESGKEIEVLHHTLRSDYDVMWYKCLQVKNDLKTALSCFYPSVRLEVFGSTVMGIAFKDSDFDFYIKLSQDESNIESVQVIENVMKILARANKFSNFLPKLHERVPILKCYHIQTGYDCDLSFSHPSVIRSSHFIKQLLNYDLRAYDLVSIIKYWMKMHNCAGKNQISNYGVIWLMIFYLQSLPKPILPPILELQIKMPSNTIPNSLFNYQLASGTQTQWCEYLCGFFKFYNEFNFDLQLICPLYGKAYDKSKIMIKQTTDGHQGENILKLNITNLREKFEKCICIQNPFDDTEIVPHYITKKSFHQIKSKIRRAVEIIAMERSSEPRTILLALFDPNKFKDSQQISNKASCLRIEAANYAIVAIKELVIFTFIIFIVAKFFLMF